MSRNLFPLVLTALIPAGAAFADVPNVAVDIAPVHSLVTRVMEGVGTPALIVTPGASPHEYSLRPSQARALQEADVVFWVSRGMTPWMEDGVKTLATDAAVVELLETEGTLQLPFRQSALFSHDHGEEMGHGGHDGHDNHDHDAKEHEHDQDDHAEHEHDHEEHGEHDDHAGHDHENHADHDHEEAHKDHEGHDHEEGHDDHAEGGHDGHAHGDEDPHAWLSIENGAHWLDVIAARLSEVDPENAGAYQANAQEGQAELDALKAEISGILEPVRGRNFIVFHDAYQYFEKSFEFPASGAISLSDASDPSPARITEVQNRVAEQNVTCVLSEPQFNPGIIRAVMDGSEAKTGVLDPLGADLEPGAALYPDVLRNLAKALAGCL
ncbi:metal ABC transporter solute-binding protein, Zn/Mn family [Neptunicoccus cionae]|uniref:metal ABC transporter solute-binding protein, Zn/Mn family n=1 Tax=Neptunicoccus cionae TaxID=2035344 RepID=UPI000C777548|nr:zinc ABC transporter substrate-binding protein [Amylibacter cionae]PLS21407.1 zinc transporter [Amylibacter cionae]